ncbi:predicted protein [Nematostella vectensis]|uniref:Mannosylglycerate hydrolase MGH1-like glycoside hydrolase domain-containing protein n=1 Tax=Nematostella vectensis TaxID=45351 RepID=A7S8Q8_NEMVE|nr:predicted protein [Nematostella vectensis]|eukprot:XP_001631929.1 predicted protein [Nematostella vectensis]
MVLEKETAESTRLKEDKLRERNWKRWGPYLSERQWGTVREDYSPDGSCWDYFSHDQARSRAYRWGEDGLLGMTDRQCRLCFGLALWNGKDPILKERLFGLTGSEGNHGEDVKECYYYLDSTPTHSYMKALYKYPQEEFPYSRLIDENRRRSRDEPEFELIDSGVFDDSRYWDVTAEYAKNTPNNILINITIKNCGPMTASLHVLPTLWYRNTWIWGCKHEGCTVKARMMQTNPGSVECWHESLGKYVFVVDTDQDGGQPEMLFTENETNSNLLYNYPNYTNYTKDAFHRYIINKEQEAVNPKKRGTKVAAHYVIQVPSGNSHTLKCRLMSLDEMVDHPFAERSFGALLEQRRREADEFYHVAIPASLTSEQKLVARQSYAGLLWSKQFYHYIIHDWLEGDPEQPRPPATRLQGRNSNPEWRQLFNKDVVSMPDKWEYPWYATWDLAFHMLPMAKVDPEFAKDQLMLFLREWYMAPNGQMPAYEFALSDVNPPVHALAVHMVYKTTGRKGHRDNEFLARCFQKLLINFTWWVNRKDPSGNNIFGGGFLGLDNIGIFDRSKDLPVQGCLMQADGTAWMAFYCVVMLGIALDLAVYDSSYEDMASKFFEHFTQISDAINSMRDGSGLWDEQDGFYYDHLMSRDGSKPLRVRSMVGLVPLFACLVLEDEFVQKLPGFKKRLDWFLENRKDLASQISYMDVSAGTYHHLLAIPTQNQLRRVLSRVLNESEFLSPYGVRSLSLYHKDHPYELEANGDTYCVQYVPGESNTFMFGGNSNWRGPIWICMNQLIIECLERYDYFYGDTFKIECPTGSGNLMRLRDVSHELSRRLTSLFLPDEKGRRPCHGNEMQYANDPNWNQLVLFYEYFHPETGRGCGASHQTGWTALVTRMLDKLATEGN